MTKEKYLKELRSRLASLPEREIEDALLYCEEYFDEAGEENFNSAMNDLGVPARFAAQIKAQYAIRQNDELPVNEKKKTKSLAKNGWIIFLGIITAPFSITVALMVLVCLLMVAILTSVPVIIVGTLCFALFIIAVLLGAFAIKTAFVSIGAGLLLLGGCLVILSLSIYSYALVKVVITKTFPFVIKVLTEMFEKVRGVTHEKN